MKSMYHMERFPRLFYSFQHVNLIQDPLHYPALKDLNFWIEKIVNKKRFENNFKPLKFLSLP